MARPERYEFDEAFHLVTVKGYPGGHVFYDAAMYRKHVDLRCNAPDAETFESLLWDVCEQYNAGVHAYMLTPNSSLMILQTLGAPLSWIIHDLLARYSRHMTGRKLLPDGTTPFPRRYKSQLVQPMKLPYAVRYVQRSEISTNSRRRALDHPFSSHPIYSGRRPRPPCFVVTTMRRALQSLGYSGANGYFEFMGRPDSPSITKMLSQNIIGEASFAEHVREGERKPLRKLSPDYILREVTGNLLHTEPTVACTPSHLGAQARALVAWYAMRTGTARIGAVASWFGVTSSDLRYLIRRHRRIIPQHFERPLPDLFSVLSDRAVLPARGIDCQRDDARFAHALAG